jgi:hypothetical protein
LKKKFKVYDDVQMIMSMMLIILTDVVVDDDNDNGVDVCDTGDDYGDDLTKK